MLVGMSLDNQSIHNYIESNIQFDVVISSGEEQTGELVFTPTKQPLLECSRYVLYKWITWVSLVFELL